MPTLGTGWKPLELAATWPNREARELLSWNSTPTIAAKARQRRLIRIFAIPRAERFVFMSRA
jgi:hypothetical protein